MAVYEINIQLSPQTIRVLSQSGFALWAFKGVRAQAAGGAPVLWYSTTQFNAVMQVDWEQQYQAFLSNSQIIPNGRIDVAGTANLDLGQTANITPSGQMTVTAGGPGNAMAILNQTSQQWTVGLSQTIAGQAAPTCALPLHGQNLIQIAPVERVLLMFVSNQANAGTVVLKAPSGSLLVDLTAQTSRTVGYDINDGWTWGGANWANAFPPMTALPPLLIQS